MTTILTLQANADATLLRGELQRLGVWAQALADSSGQPAAFSLGQHSCQVPKATLAALPGVAHVFATAAAHPLLDAWRDRNVVVQRCGKALEIGPKAQPVLAAGPCSAESEAQVLAAAKAVQRAGGSLLRGGAYKPRTSPYAFAGDGPDALGWLRRAADRYDLALVTECLSETNAVGVAAVADLIQIGSRNMQNFALLRAVGMTQKPVLLKRGAAATVAEWRLAAEHLLRAGADGVIFCERGMRGVDGETRNMLDLGAVALLATVDKLAVWVDPSHAAGRRDLIAPLSRAGLAVGAHGLLIETHPDAAAARSDGAQALPFDALHALGKDLQFTV